MINVPNDLRTYVIPNITHPRSVVNKRQSVQDFLDVCAKWAKPGQGTEEDIAKILWKSQTSWATYWLECAGYRRPESRSLYVLCASNFAL